jgi:hypothetical protein
MGIERAEPSERSSEALRSPSSDLLVNRLGSRLISWWTPARRWRAFSWVVLGGLLFVLFRAMFAQGQLVVSDIYVGFPAVTTSQGWLVYLSQWNPGILGYASSQPASLALFSILTLGGIPPTLLQPLFFVGLSFVGAVSFQFLLEPYLVEPKFALLGAGLFLLSPYLFISYFNSDNALPFALLLPTFLLLAFRIADSVSVRRVLLLGVGLGFVYSIVTLGPAYSIPLVVVPPIVVMVTKRSLRAGLVGFGALLTAVGMGLLVNAPFYFGNLSYFSGGALQAAYSNALAIMPVTYGFSSPVHFFSLLGAGLLPRYSIYYPPTSESMLVAFSAVALSGLLFVRSKRSRGLGLLAGAVYIFCGTWIFLTRGEVTYPLYRAIGFLSALNYPDAFYAYIAVSLTVLATLLLDEVAAREPSRSGLSREASRTRTLNPTRASLLRSHLRRALGSAGRRPLSWTTCIVVVVLLVVPAVFYLQSGDYNVFQAPRAYEFPEPWGATAPPVFYAMYGFLQSHGGAMNTRVLILPYPGQGGAQFSPFAYNTLDLPEYQGPSSAPTLLAAGQGPYEFSTAVLNYMVSNRTNEIGILLGEASVKYILVDLAANFTSPPTWTWNSLVGAPSYFLGLLRSQLDLKQVFSSSLFVAFLNLDYQPEVTGASGVVVVNLGNASVPLNHSVASWPANRTEWSPPGPSGLIEGLNTTSTGYEVFGIDGSGVMNLTFSNATASITGTSTRFDNNGLYVQSTMIPVTSQPYVVRFDQTVSGPIQPGVRSYVTVWGFSSRGNYLWGIPSYEVPGGTGSNATIPFSPRQLSSQTADVAVTIAFPFDFGSGVPVSYSVSNLSLSVDLPALPSPFLASALVARLPAESTTAGSATILNSEFSNSTDRVLTAEGVSLGRLCVGICAMVSGAKSDQLLFAYASIPPASSLNSIEPSLSALSGEVLSVNGSRNADIAVNPTRFASVAVRASGVGTISLSNGSAGLVARFSIDNSSLSWISTNLTQGVSTSQVSVNISGSVQFDSLWLGAPGSLNGASNGAVLREAGVTVSQSGLTQYNGELGSATSFVTLVQSFDSGWSMTVGPTTGQSILVAGWENGFVVPRPNVSGVSTYEIKFTGQTQHVAFVALQVAALVILLGSLIVVSFPRRVRMLTHAFRRAMPQVRTNRKRAR